LPAIFLGAACRGYLLFSISASKTKSSSSFGTAVQIITRKIAARKEGRRQRPQTRLFVRFIFIVKEYPSQKLNSLKLVISSANPVWLWLIGSHYIGRNYV
jgi:hypothetical protein